MMRLPWLEGLAVVARRGALPVLVDAALSGVAETQLRALGAIDTVAERPPHDPCLPPPILRLTDEDACLVRVVGPTADWSCGAVLPAEEAASLATTLQPLLVADDPSVQLRAVTTIGKVASPASIEPLERLLESLPASATPAESSAGPESRYEDTAAPYALRHAVTEALQNIRDTEEGWRRQAENAATL